jgi:hypothetical protein
VRRIVESEIRIGGIDRSDDRPETLAETEAFLYARREALGISHGPSLDEQWRRYWREKLEALRTDGMPN